VFLAFEEPVDAIRRNASVFGWDLARLEREGRLRLLHGQTPRHVVESGEFDIGGLVAILRGQVAELGAQRVVIDAVDVLLRMFREAGRREDQLFALHEWLLEHTVTGLVTMKQPGREPGELGAVEHIVDCVLRLDHRVVGQVATRRMRVLKYRGSPFLSNEYPYVISRDGIVLMPISTSVLPQQLLGPKFPTGVSGLDRLLDGGLLHGACVLVAGTSGTGKTVLACSIALAACARDERVLYVSFEEGAASLVGSMRSPGIDLGPAIDAGKLRILTALPESMGVEEHLLRIVDEIASLRPRLLVVDAISACRRMGSDEAAFDFLVRLVTHCRSEGITCLLVNQTVQADHLLSGVGISSLVDTLILLEQRWPDESHLRRLLIVKSRGSRHAHAYNELRITDRGLDVGPTTPSSPAAVGGAR
jgi:circadian clock protein KaiC